MGVALQAWNGTADWEKPARTMRALFPMYDTSFQITVLRRSGISSVAMLDKLDVGAGPRARTGGVYVPKILSALGVSPARDTVPGTKRARIFLPADTMQWFGAKPEDLKVAEGIASSGTKHVSYGDLIGGRTFSLSLDHQQPPATKDPRDYKIVGKTVSRLHIADKMTGKFTYMHDFSVPGTLHGRAVRPPAIGAIAAVAEVEVKRSTGEIRNTRFYVVHDCGQIINPDARSEEI